MVTWKIIALPAPFAVRRVHTHLAQSRFEDEPILIEILRHVGPAEHVAQKRARRLRIVGINQRVYRGNHVVLSFPRRCLYFSRAALTKRKSAAGIRLSRRF